MKLSGMAEAVQQQLHSDDAATLSFEDRQQVLTLGSCAWIAERHNVLITGPTGIGKSFLACAFVERGSNRGRVMSGTRTWRPLRWFNIAGTNGLEVAAESKI